MYYAAHTAGIQWQYGENPTTVFDPANLGEPFVGLFASAVAAYRSYPVAGAFDPSAYDVTPRWSFTIDGSARLRALLLESRLSLDLQAGGFYIQSLPDSTLPTPYLQPTIGGQSSFSGYSAGYATVNSMAWASLGVLTDPLVNKRSSVQWYQRLSLEARVEAGAVQYYAGGLAWGFPVSAEVTLRHSFYLSPNRESTAYVTLGVPLNDFLRTITLPFQVYAGYSY